MHGVVFHNKKNTRKAWIGALATTTLLKYCSSQYQKALNDTGKAPFTIGLQALYNTLHKLSYTLHNISHLLHAFNPFAHNDTFWRHWETSLLKTLWVKEKLLLTSNFSFSHSVLYLFG